MTGFGTLQNLLTEPSLYLGLSAETRDSISSQFGHLWSSVAVNSAVTRDKSAVQLLPEHADLIVFYLVPLA